MKKEYYMDNDGIVLLKKDCGQIWQYSFSAHIWYNVSELKGIEDHPELVTKITEEKAKAFIEQIENTIKSNQPKKTR